VITGCGVARKTKNTVKSIKNGDLEIIIDIAPKANQNNPVALDMVMVYDKALLKQLQGMTAKDWFEKRSQVKLNYPGDIGLDSWSWEWVPGQIVKINPIAVKSKTLGAIIYANYLSPGEHRAVFDPYKSIVLSLKEKNFSVEPVKK
jgi:type VI secretion system protein